MAQHVLHWAAQIRAPQRHKIQRLHVSLHLVRPMHCFHVVAGFAHLNINNKIPRLVWIILVIVFKQIILKKYMFA